MTTATSDLNYNPNESKLENIPHRLKKTSSRETDTASYIADMILELRNLAKAVEFKTLQGLLEISYYEAFSCANKLEIPPGEEQLLHQLGADARKAVAAG